eukprot:263981-Pyramimonas_sp.AAC.1
MRASCCERWRWLVAPSVSGPNALVVGATTCRRGMCTWAVVPLAWGWVVPAGDGLGCWSVANTQVNTVVTPMPNGPLGEPERRT